MKSFLKCLALILVTPCLCSAALAQASSAQPSINDNVAQATRAIRDLCLSGQEYEFKVDAQGTLAFKSLKPNAKGNITVNAKETPGAASDFDQKLRALVNDSIRTCMSPHIQQIVDALLRNPQTEAFWFRAYMLANWAGNDATGTPGEFPKYVDKQNSVTCDLNHLGVIATCWDNRLADDNALSPAFKNRTDISSAETKWCVYKGRATVLNSPQDHSVALGDVYVCSLALKP